jgi:hypothetical protein
MEDGMWMLGDFWLVQAEKEEYYNSGLFRIPEPSEK